MGCCLILEEKVQEVSNRYSSILSAFAASFEIEDREKKTVAESEEKTENIPKQEIKESDRDFLGDEFFVDYPLWEESVPLDYLELFYGKENPLTTTYNPWNDEEKNIATTISDTEAEMLTEEEAQEIIEEAQYAAIVGVTYNSEKLRKLDLWIKFEPALFGIFKANSVTSEVNYSAL